MIRNPLAHWEFLLEKRPRSWELLVKPLAVLRAAGVTPQEFRRATLSNTLPLLHCIDHTPGSFDFFCDMVEMGLPPDTASFPDYGGSFERPMLHNAIEAGNVAAVGRLLDLGANPRSEVREKARPDGQILTPLGEALRTGALFHDRPVRHAIAARLIGAGAVEGMTPQSPSALGLLTGAIVNADVELLEMLLKSGVPLSASEAPVALLQVWLESAIRPEVAIGRSLEDLRALVQGGYALLRQYADPQAQCPSPSSLMHEVGLERGNPLVIEALIREGGFVREADGSGPLHAMVPRHSPQFCRYVLPLLESEWDQANAKGVTPRHLVENAPPAEPSADSQAGRYALWSIYLEELALDQRIAHAPGDAPRLRM